MTAYVIVDAAVTDPAKYEGYQKLVPGSLIPFGGRVLAPGGAALRLEGDWSPSRIVVIEFPTHEQAKAWYQSVEYTAARRTRAGAARMNIVAIDGV